MNRQISLTSRLAAAALLVGVAVIGCGHGNAASTQAAGFTPAAQSSPVNQASPSTSPSASATDSAVPSASTVAVDQAATPDPLDSPLNSVNQLLNGINSSLQDSGSGGGE